MTEKNALDRLERESSGFMQANVIASMAEFDLATRILEQGNSADAEELCRMCSCDMRGMEALLDALCALGYLVKSQTREKAVYAVAEEYKTLLDSREKSSYIPMLRHRACILRSWSRLSWAVQDGLPQKKETPSFLGEETDSVSFIRAMNAIALHLTETTMQTLEEAGILTILPPNPSLLDIGGASGTYTEAFLRRIPLARATLVDLPVGIKEAEKRFAQSDLFSRVSLVTCDFTKEELPKSFDFAWISAIIHQLSRAESRTLYAKTLRALRPKGIVAVRDFVMDKSRTDPASGSLFGLNMLVNTEKGRVYTFEEISEDLQDAGFVNVRYSIALPTMSSVVIAEKSEA